MKVIAGIPGVAVSLETTTTFGENRLRARARPLQIVRQFMETFSRTKSVNFTCRSSPLNDRGIALTAMDWLLSQPLD